MYFSLLLGFKKEDSICIFRRVMERKPGSKISPQIPFLALGLLGRGMENPNSSTGSRALPSDRRRWPFSLPFFLAPYAPYLSLEIPRCFPSLGSYALCFSASESPPLTDPLHLQPNLLTPSPTPCLSPLPTGLQLP